VALIEHPEICDGCHQWQHLKDRRFVEHELSREPRNAHERRAWKKSGKPTCPGSGKKYWSTAQTIWIDDGTGLD
jgi:hypothetical protein